MIRILCFLMIPFLFLTCKNEEEVSSIEKVDVLSNLGIEDYEAIIRHPISLANQIDSSKLAGIDFVETTFDFDTIAQGDKVSFNFEFNNTGNESLYILDTRVSCGCTVTEYNHEAVKPGQSGVISIQFDSSDKLGFQDKSIVVISNTVPNESILRIKGIIK